MIADIKDSSKIVLAPLLTEGQKLHTGTGIEKKKKKGLSKRPLNKGDRLIVPHSALFSLPFAIIDTSPEGIVVINTNTDVNIKEEAAKTLEPELFRLSYEDIGGYKDQIEKLKESHPSDKMFFY